MINVLETISENPGRLKTEGLDPLEVRLSKDNLQAYFLTTNFTNMAKKIIIPPKKSMRKQIESIVRKGPKIQSQAILAKGASQSNTASVQRSRVPNPSENQRGRILSRDERSLTR